MAAPVNTSTEQNQQADEHHIVEEQQPPPLVIPDILEKPVTDEHIIRHFSTSVKPGSILDVHGFHQHVLNKDLGAKVIMSLENAGLYNYVTFAHRSHHLVDAAEFYLNATVPQDSPEHYLDVINSHVQGMKISFEFTDIQTVFRFPERDNSYASSCGPHAYDKRVMWELIKTPNQPQSVPFPIKKKMLKLDYEFTIDILSKMIENKVSGTDDISDDKLRMLSALMNNFKVDWSKVVFDYLKKTVISGICKTTGKITKVLGFGFVIGELLKSKGVILREGVPVHRTHFHMRQKPQNYDRRRAIEMGIAVPPPPTKSQKKKKSTKEPEPSKKRKTTGKLPPPKKKRAPSRAIEREAEQAMPSISAPPVEIEPPAPVVHQPHTSPVQSTQAQASSEDDLSLAQLAELVRRRKATAQQEVDPPAPPTKNIGLPPDCSWSSGSSSTEESSSEGEADMPDRSVHSTDYIDRQYPSSPAEDLAQPEDMRREVEDEDTYDDRMQTGNGAEASMEAGVLPTSPIDADAELARQMAQDEFEEFEEGSSTEDILSTELRRVIAWQKWRMSSLPVLAETLNCMWDEEIWALNWMGTNSVFAATRPDEIDRVFQEKLAGKDKGKGKARAVDDIDPAEQARADKRLLRRVQLLSKFQEQFVDRTPGVGTSHAAEETSQTANDSAQHSDEASPELPMVVYQEPLTTTPLDREEPQIFEDESRTVLDTPERQSSFSPSLG